MAAGEYFAQMTRADMRVQFRGGEIAMPQQHPVSYTHLDVYKRQGLIQNLPQSPHALASVKAAKQFKVTLRNFIQHHETPHIQRMKGSKMAGILFLCLFQIGDKRTARCV